MKNWERSFLPTTKSLQEESFISAWEDFTNFPENGRRLLAALSYFHTGARILRSGKIAGEFVGEAVLNFCKTLQSLFGEKRDEVRAGLDSIGILDDVIEGDLLPLMILRNSLDVAHIGGSLLTEDEMSTLEFYIDRVDISLQNVLMIYLRKAISGELEIIKSSGKPLPPEGKTALQKIRQRLESTSDKGPSERHLSIRIRR